MFYFRDPLRTIVFFDGQNLYHLARNAWAPAPQVPGSPYGYPSYDVEKIAALMVGRQPGRILQQIRFYTGVPEPRSPQTTFWHGFWGNKLRYLGSRGIYVYRGRLNPGGQEKGVDVSLAVDLRAAHVRGRIRRCDHREPGLDQSSRCFDPTDYRP